MFAVLIGLPVSPETALTKTPQLVMNESKRLYSLHLYGATGLSKVRVGRWPRSKTWILNGKTYKQTTSSDACTHNMTSNSLSRGNDPFTKCKWEFLCVCMRERA